MTAEDACDELVRMSDSNEVDEDRRKELLQVKGAEELYVKVMAERCVRSIYGTHPREKTPNKTCSVSERVVLGLAQGVSVESSGTEEDDKQEYDFYQKVLFFPGQLNGEVGGKITKTTIEQVQEEWELFPTDKRVTLVISFEDPNMGGKFEGRFDFSKNCKFLTFGWAPASENHVHVPKNIINGSRYQCAIMVLRQDDRPMIALMSLGGLFKMWVEKKRYTGYCFFKGEREIEFSPSATDRGTKLRIKRFIKA